MDKIIFFARILTTYDQLQKWCWPITTLIISILSATATLYLQPLSTASVTSSIASKASETLSRALVAWISQKNNIFESFMYCKLCFSNSIPNFIILNIPIPNCISTTLTVYASSFIISFGSYLLQQLHDLFQQLWDIQHYPKLCEQLQELYLDKHRHSTLLT